ncbi:sporulation protein YqfC [Hathewaya massiliensis]|uniref:sporulation protein YqfC n=1 Tax=Hathewaya massiliensis TaxID=1964382 RepID=UPI0011589AAC|nr:sporulation protein YqfC [Hathewaya massiliensis]
MGNLIRSSKAKIAKTLDMPSEALLNVPKFTIMADQEITVENHMGILSFKKEEIILKTSIGKVIIKGGDFEILFLGESTITLSGKFEAVNYERSDSKDE